MGSDRGKRLLTLFLQQHELHQELKTFNRHDPGWVRIKKDLQASSNELGALLSDNETTIQQWNKARKSACAEGVDRVDLSGERLTRKELGTINLSDAILYKTDFSGASLHGAQFCNVDLTKTKGLRATALRGTDLSGAILPERLDFDVAYSGNAARVARNTFFYLILANVLAFLSCRSIGDEDFFRQSFLMVLPFLKTSTSIDVFFWVTPFLIGIYYLYFLAYLDTLIEEYVRLPRYFASGRHVTRQIYPWLFNDFILWSMNMISRSDGFSHRRNGLIFIFSWFPAPLVLGYLWWVYLKLHHWLAYVHAGCFAFCIFVGVYYFLKARRDLALPNDTRRTRHFFSSRGWFWVVVVDVTSLIFLFTFFIVHGSSEPKSLMRYRHLDLAEIKLLEKEQVKGRKNKIQNMNFLNAKKAMLQGFDFSGVHIQDGKMNEAHLENADLSGAWLNRTHFHDAHLDGADMNGAHLEEAELIRTSLKNVILEGAHLNGAVLVNTDLTQANLRNSHLTDSTFRPVSLEDRTFLMEGADFSGADFSGVALAGIDFSMVKNMSKVDMTGAILTNSCFNNQILDGAVFDIAQLDGALLDGAKMIGVSLIGASLNDVFLDRANLTNADLDGLRDWENASFQNANLFQVKNPPPGFLAFARQCGAVELDAQQWAEHRKVLKE